MATSRVKCKKQHAQVIQQTMFDIPAVQKDKEYSHSTKEKMNEREIQNFSELGLNAVVEGKSVVFKNFSDYIHSLKNY